MTQATVFNGTSTGEFSMMKRGCVMKYILGLLLAISFNTFAVEYSVVAPSDVDVSGTDLTVSGPSALPAAVTNQDGGDLVLRGGQKATGGGVSGDVQITSAVLQDKTDVTKKVSWDITGVTTATTRTITMPDSDVDLGLIGPTEGSAVLSTGEVGGNKYLREDGDGTSSWQTVAGGASPLTTKGDIYTYSTVDARLAIGTNDFVLTADSAEATGLKWAAASGGGFTSFVDDETAGSYAIGPNALGSLTNGFSNIAWGDEAGALITFEDRNIFIGDHVAQFSTGEFDNTLVGAEVGDTGAVGSKNSMFGSKAYGGNSTSSSDENSGFGYTALGGLTSGTDNSAFGSGSSFTLTAGFSNSTFGKGSGGTVTLGDFNGFFGVGSGKGLTTGDYNLHFGSAVTVSAFVSADSDRLVIGNIGTGHATAAIEGHLQARADLDYSVKALTITGPSAFSTASTNQDGGNLVLQAGQKASGGGVNGLTLVNDTVYGIMSVQANATAETTVDTTARKITAWNTDGLEKGVDVDNTSDDITCDTAGTYSISASVSFSGSSTSTYIIELYKNAAATGFALERKLGTGGDLGNAGLAGIVTCAATDTFSLYQSTVDGSVMTVTEAQLAVHRISN